MNEERRGERDMKVESDRRELAECHPHCTRPTETSLIFSDPVENVTARAFCPAPSAQHNEEQGTLALDS